MGTDPHVWFCPSCSVGESPLLTGSLLLLPAWHIRELKCVPASAFDPGSSLNTDQWAQVAKDLGAHAVVLTVKHEGGFCLWPTNQSDYSIQASPFFEDWPRYCGRVRRLLPQVWLAPGVLYRSSRGRLDDATATEDQQQCLRGQGASYVSGAAHRAVR